MIDIQIVSDLHIEKNNSNIINGLDYITPSAPILILAGDIGSLYRIDQLINFFKSIYKYFEYILYIPGNNEYYQYNNYKISFDKLNQRLTTLTLLFNNIKILNKSYFIIDNYLFCGCILWSFIHYELPSFVKIFDFDKDIYNSKNYNEKIYIKNMINFSYTHNLKPVIITHYPPSKLLLDNSKLKFYYKRLYYNNLDYLFNKDLIWIYGHTHSNISKQIENSYFFTNQKGSNSNNCNHFKKNFTLKI
jgi:predicted phosphodiesterase